MVNRVVLVGRVFNAPELRKTNSDISVASFVLRVPNRAKNPDGTRDSIFINVTVYGAQADNVIKVVRKDSQVAVDGGLNQRNFVRKDESKGKVIEIIADSVTFLDPNPNAAKEQPVTNAVEETKIDDVPEESSGDNLDQIGLPDDDLPF